LLNSLGGGTAGYEAAGDGASVGVAGDGASGGVAGDGASVGVTGNGKGRGGVTGDGVAAGGVAVSSAPNAGAAATLTKSPTAQSQASGDLPSIRSDASILCEPSFLSRWPTREIPARSR
jgi:hypothetical protein